MNAKVDLTGVVLSTTRLILRNFIEEDLDDFYEYAKVPGVGEMAGWVHHANIEETKRVLNIFIERKKTFAICLKETGKVIGSIGIEEYDEKNLSPEINELQGREIGYVLSKDYWGHGYMPEAEKEVIRYCFNELKFDFLICGFFYRNLQSKRVNEKCLFKHYKDIYYQTRYNTLEPTSLNILFSNDFEEYMEKLELFDCQGRMLNTFIYRGEEAPKGTYYGVIDVITKNSDGKYLLTLRSKEKRSFPNLYETTGGAVRYQEEFLAGAKRELFEETGIVAGKMTFIGKYLGSQTFYTQFLNEVDIEPNSIVLQDGETSDYKWVTKEEFIDFFNSKECVPPQGIRIRKVLNKI